MTHTYTDIHTDTHTLTYTYTHKHTYQNTHTHIHTRWVVLQTADMLKETPQKKFFEVWAFPIGVNVDGNGLRAIVNFQEP